MKKGDPGCSRAMQGDPGCMIYNGKYDSDDFFSWLHWDKVFLGIDW